MFRLTYHRFIYFGIWLSPLSFMLGLFFLKIFEKIRIHLGWPVLSIFSEKSFQKWPFREEKWGWCSKFFFLDYLGNTLLKRARLDLFIHTLEYFENRINWKKTHNQTKIENKKVHTQTHEKETLEHISLTNVLLNN